MLIAESHKDPPDTSSRLAEQALRALRELLRGFQTVDLARHDPRHLHAGLLTVVLRLVFLRYAEDRGLLPGEPSASADSVTSLHLRLRDDAARDPDAMDHRFGAWSTLLARFRLLHSDGALHLFDPDRYPFLAARIPDSVLWRVLQALLVLEDEPRAYRTLDIEHIGSVYESLIGYTLERADGLSLQPGEARRRSGSHYTPRSLSEPIVRTALRPVLAALGERPTPAQILALKICDPAMGSGAFLIEAARQLGEHLRRAWDLHGAPKLPGAADLGLHARRLVARHCLYGVDNDPFAVDLARLSLWLVTRASDQPFTFLDHALRHGDSLVGPTTTTIDPPVPPFHWELEFPEVFARDNPGFDCIVGNPPFLGGTMISTAHSRRYLEWLLAAYPGAGNRMDLAAYFFRRAFSKLRLGGTLGLVSTNTIAQGDTRSGGLRWICAHGGTIYNATRRLRWPGLAAVTVSIVHILKGPTTTPRTLDGRPVATITAFLSHAGGDDDPAPLASNAGLTFEGYKPAGQGFIFDDRDDAANPTAVMRALLRHDPRNAARIFPYLGGAELNQHPTQAPSRFIISFGDMDEQRAGQWPDLLGLVRERVKPQRDLAARDGHRKHWWRFGETRPGLSAALQGRARILATARVSPRPSFAFLPTGYIYSEQLVLIAIDTYAGFATLQSRVHELWARSFGSSLEDRLRYTPSDCFDTFPFPPSWQQGPALERAGERYYAHRADLMVRNNEGLTTTYNRFHDPDERAPEILELRELHAAMDRALLTAYHWTDLAARATSEFLLDHDDDEPRARKKPWRYRWPQAFHDEVLARLLDLNHRQATAERPLATRTG